MNQHADAELCPTCNHPRDDGRHPVLVGPKTGHRMTICARWMPGNYLIDVDSFAPPFADTVKSMATPIETDEVELRIREIESRGSVGRPDVDWLIDELRSARTGLRLISQKPEDGPVPAGFADAVLRSRRTPPP